jgi:hypothetical protein
VDFEEPLDDFDFAALARSAGLETLDALVLDGGWSATFSGVLLLALFWCSVTVSASFSKGLIGLLSPRLITTYAVYVGASCCIFCNKVSHID